MKKPTFGPFEPFVAAAGVAQSLRERMEQFSRAMAGGQSREVFLTWQASRDALAAALEIIGDRAEQGDAVRVKPTFQ